jgi:hypothetical protein
MFFKSRKVLVHVSRRRKDPSFWYSLDSYQKEWKGNEILRNLFKTIFTLCCGLLLLLLYCWPLSFLFSFKSLFRLFFLIRDFPHAECVFLFFLLYDPFHRHNNNTHSAAAARVCWASFLVIVEVGRRFFVRFLCGTRRLRPAQNARTQSRVKMRTNGNMHNVKQASNTHTIHAERRISCDVVGVSKKTWHMQCSTAGADSRYQ